VSPVPSETTKNPSYAGEVEIKTMREALEFVGADMRRADTREPKGVLDEREIAKLDPKSARFLAHASGVPARNLEILAIDRKMISQMESQLASLRRKYVAKESYDDVVLVIDAIKAVMKAS